MGLHCIFLIVFPNMYSIPYFALINLKNLFSLSLSMYFVNAISFASIGIFFITGISMYPMAMYFYGKNSKFFLRNFHAKKGCFVLSFIYYVLKPLIEVCVHVWYYNNPSSHLLLLGLSNIFFVLILFMIEWRMKIFVIKGIFWT